MNVQANRNHLTDKRNSRASWRTLLFPPTDKGDGRFVCLLFVGDTLVHSDLAQRLDDCVIADTLTREVAVEWLGFVSNVYARSNELIRDEIIRSCSFAAMVFMLSATDKGFDTCPIGPESHLNERLLSHDH
jgi:putative NAD(P)H nitroreductase